MRCAATPSPARRSSRPRCRARDPAPRASCGRSDPRLARAHNPDPAPPGRGITAPATWNGAIRGSRWKRIAWSTTVSCRASINALMHPREPRNAWDAATRKRAAEVLAFVRERGRVHPREVERHFAHGRVRNHWADPAMPAPNCSTACTIAARCACSGATGGTRVFEVAAHPPADDSPDGRACVAPPHWSAGGAHARAVACGQPHLPGAPARYGAPHLQAQVQAALGMRATLAELRHRWRRLVLAGRNPGSRRHAVDDACGLLALFDPVASNRRRLPFWG